MALPTNRNETATAAAPAKSTTTNALQDCIIGKKRPSGYRWINPATPNILSSAGTNTIDEQGITYSNAGQFRGLPLGQWEEATRITAFGVMHYGNVGGTWTALYRLYMNTGNGTPTLLGTLSVVNPGSGTFTLYTVTLGTPQVLPAHASLYLNQEAGAIVGQRLLLVGIQDDRL